MEGRSLDRSGLLASHGLNLRRPIQSFWNLFQQNSSSLSVQYFSYSLPSLSRWIERKIFIVPRNFSKDNFDRGDKCLSSTRCASSQRLLNYIFLLPSQGIAKFMKRFRKKPVTETGDLQEFLHLQRLHV